MERVCKEFQANIIDSTKEIVVKSPYFYDNSLKSLPKYTNLKSLSLLEHGYNNQSLEALGNITWLESLTINSEEPIEIPESFFNIKGLKEINLNKFSGNFSFLSNFKQLESLTLHNSNFIKETDFKIKLPKMKYIDIEFKAAREYSILNSCKNLIHFKSTNQLKPSGLKALSKLTNLEYLDISAECQTRKTLVDCAFLDTLTKLKVLKVKNVNLSKYKPNNNLEILEIFDESFREPIQYGFLKDLKSLKSLTIYSDYFRVNLNTFPKLNIEHLSIPLGINMTEPLNLKLFENLKSLVYNANVSLENFSLDKLDLAYIDKTSKLSGEVNDLKISNFDSILFIKGLYIKNSLTLCKFHEKDLDVDIFKEMDVKKVYIDSSFSQKSFRNLQNLYPNIKFFRLGYFNPIEKF